ncbi:nuclear transport factor 2 family protein [Sphingobacterium spiritivorum]|uniref:nuclear transport factor 2 family protein n=1 Tax=Sphingobacterium spiritivorum TaxID=258 RepID=UPI003DA4FD25
MSSIILNEHKILHIENQLREAMQKSDVGILDQLLHDDLLFVLSDGEVITKEMDLETHSSGNLVLEEITSSIDSIKQIGENVVVTLSSKIKGKMLEQYFEGNFRYLRVWKIFDGQLKVIAGSCVAV